MSRADNPNTFSRPEHKKIHLAKAVTKSYIIAYIAK